MPVCKTCGEKFPFLVRINGIERNLCNRTRCLTCSPFPNCRRIELLTPRTFYKQCVLCGKKESRRLCRSCRVKIRRYRTKAAAIKLLGGKCVKCGWSGDQAGYQFHHTRDKRFTIGNVGNKSWKRIKKELKKCILLCARCHQIRGSTRSDPRLIREAMRYQGDLLI